MQPSAKMVLKRWLNPVNFAGNILVLNKQQWIVTGSALALLAGLFFFGRDKPLSKGTPVQPHTEDSHTVLEISAILSSAKKDITPGQSAKVTAMENAITRGDLITQKIAVYGDLAKYWRDSIGNMLPSLWYMGEKAKLEKSEKNMNFAAHSYLEELRGNEDVDIKTWMAVQAKDLFTESLKLDPANDSAIVGLGSTYFFGAGGNAPPMEGILKIREVAERDSSNMFAQFMLGYGSLVSGQFDKAIERFEKVVRIEPNNKEAIFLLAEASERSGDRKKAVYWFGVGRSKVDNPDVIRAIDEKIKTLQ